MTTGPTVLITGAAGRLGSTVARLLHDEGYDLVATDRVEVGDVPYRFVQADLLDHLAAAGLLDGVDVLIHIGNQPGIGSTPPQIVFNHNVSINANVFQAAAEHGVGSIVFASTLQLIGSHADERTVVTPTKPPAYPLSGATTPDPANLYALSKAVSEHMLRYYAERCGVAGTAVRFPMLHRHADGVKVGTGDETEVDLLEGFTGLTYDDAARLVLAVIRAELNDYHVFMVGTAHRHRDLTTAELIRRYYPDVPPGTADLIDITDVIDATGWRPSDDYHRAGTSVGSEETKR
jgi:nucleoside-diphosphate-sugar epimerase